MKSGAKGDPCVWIHIGPFKQIHPRDPPPGALPLGERQPQRPPTPASYPTSVIFGCSYNGDTCCHLQEQGRKVPAKILRGSPGSRVCHLRRIGLGLAEADDSHGPCHCRVTLSNAIQGVSPLPWLCPLWAFTALALENSQPTAPSFQPCEGLCPWTLCCCQPGYDLP